MHWHLMSDLRFILLYLIYSDMGQLQRVLNSIRYEGTDGNRWAEEGNESKMPRK